MTRSRGEFDTRHGDAETDRGAEGALGRLRAWLSFHRIETLLAAWVVVGVVLVGLVPGGRLLVSPESTIALVRQTVFWVTLLVAVPLLPATLLAHAAVDLYRVVAHDGRVGSWVRVFVRTLQTASALVFAAGVTVMLQDETPADAEFNPAALVSAFLMAVGLVGMLAFVAADALVRYVADDW